jgi:serine/threonine protein kinase
MPRLGDYELRSVLGRGATGVVYEARSETGERVAVKVLDPGFVSDEAAHDRLRREATILGALRDDHLVRVVELVDAEAEPYLVVEYVDGASLRAVIGESSRLAPADMIAVMDDLLAGLAVAHDHGVIHRDVKPENILVDRHGTGKLADFGLALSRNDASTPFHAGQGTPAYMSPEQVRGEPLDARLLPGQDVDQRMPAEEGFSNPLHRLGRSGYGPGGGRRDCAHFLIVTRLRSPPGYNARRWQIRSMHATSSRRSGTTGARKTPT